MIARPFVSWISLLLVTAAWCGCAGISSNPPASQTPPAAAVTPKAPVVLAQAQFHQLAVSRYAIGSSDAPVTIVEFADYECPYCAMDQPVLAKVMSDYPGRVRLVFRDYPIGHPHSILYAQAARCAAEQGGFWKMHDYILNHPDQLDPDKLATYASNLGLDGEALQSCIASGRYRKSIAADAALAERAGATGTPVFFVNGRMLDGMQGYADLKGAIDQALAASEKPPSP